MRYAVRPAWVKQAFLRPFARPGLPDRGQVHLTFDDGPDSAHTPGVMDRLRSAQTTGTFFLVGEQVRLAPGLALALAREGHQIGNHTLSHRRLCWSDLHGASDEVTRCQNLLPAGSRWFRPPFGRLTPGLWLAARQSGLRVVTWTHDSNDWQCRTAEDAAGCAAEVLAQARGGDTILFHDTHHWIGSILDAVLPGLAARGLLAESGE